MAEAIESTEELSLEFEGWCCEEGKCDQIDVKEMLICDQTLTSEQREWLEDFSARWDVAQKREDAEGQAVVLLRRAREHLVEDTNDSMDATIAAIDAFFAARDRETEARQIMAGEIATRVE